MIYLVTGLGRSGTSCVAEMLHVSGIDMGFDGTVDEYNPRGYWEDREVNSVNAGIHDAAGGSIYWWPFPCDIPANLDRRIIIGMNNVNEKRRLARIDTWGAKDCRFVSNWHVWREVFDFNEVVFVIVRRRIDSIFKSMMRVPGMSAPPLEGRPKEEQVSEIIVRHCAILGQLSVPNVVEIWYEDLFRPEGRERVQERMSKYYDKPLQFHTVMDEHRHF